MSFRLPVAPQKYSKSNEDNARRVIAQAVAELESRILLLESAPAPAVAPTPPSAAFTSVKTNLSVAFTDTSVAGTAPIVEWLWNFGDGTAASTAQFPTHVYATAGSYSVTLTVTDGNALFDSGTQAVTVYAPASQGGITFVVRGAGSPSDISSFPWWNGAQIGGLTPNNCVSTINAFKAAGLKAAVRLYSTAACLNAGVFDINLWKASVDRFYTDVTLRDFINGEALAKNIPYFDIIDDIQSGNRWGRLITKAEVEEMAAHSRSRWPDLPAWARARFTQLSGYSYTMLQGCTSIYLFGRGGVSQGGMTAQQWRIADCQAYTDAEQAARASINIPLNSAYGLNIIDGGDGSSGIAGGIVGKFKMGAQELKDYGAILVPASTGNFQMWEWDADGSANPYLLRDDITSSMNYIRGLCDVR
ncbi:MAG: PKD domain-containing protein [Sphingosinicella sp.]|nr:PKD domain-containing protein [Sphingosinicella sp.]